MSPCLPVVTHHSAATLRAWAIWRHAHPLWHWTPRAIIGLCARAAAVAAPLLVPLAAAYVAAPYYGAAAAPLPLIGQPDLFGGGAYGLGGAGYGFGGYEYAGGGVGGDHNPFETSFAPRGPLAVGAGAQQGESVGPPPLLPSTIESPPHVPLSVAQPPLFADRAPTQDVPAPSGLLCVLPALLLALGWRRA